MRTCVRAAGRGRDRTGRTEREAAVPRLACRVRKRTGDRDEPSGP